jgi:3-oxoacyl-[acyl-carrier protein] reductase
MTTSLAGRTAIVTGSGRNIGRGIVLGFAAAGANVVVNGHRDRAAVEAVVAEARALGVGAIGCMADVCDPDAMVTMAAAARDAFGTVDIAVANVGLRETKPLSEITPEAWRAMIESNLSSAFYLARAVLPLMAERRWGRIIHMAGRTAFFPKENRAHVSSAKAGLHALAKDIALEYGPFGVTANTIAPGSIETARSDASHPGHAEEFARRAKAMAVRRLGTVDDVVEACLYLASDAAGYVTGHVLHINGGEFMY